MVPQSEGRGLVSGDGGGGPQGAPGRQTSGIRPKPHIRLCGLLLTGDHREVRRPQHNVTLKYSEATG